MLPNVLENRLIPIRPLFLVALTVVAQSPNATQPAAGGAKRDVQIEFVDIAPGEFMMGCLPDDKDCLEDEVPRHKVRLTKGFEMGKYEVTQAQWETVMGPGSIRAQSIRVRPRARTILWIA